MATRQLGNSYVTGQPEAVHAGENAYIVRISVSTTVSPTDTWFIGKLPVNAIPTDAIFYGGTATGIGTFTAKFGTSASPSAFFASATYSAALYRTTKRLGTQAQCSLSDDKMPRYVNLQMIATAGATLGYIGDLIVFYKMPGQSL
jgi:hypothetical protein